MKRATAGAAVLSTFGSGLQNAVNTQTASLNPRNLKITKISTANMDGYGTHLFVKLETNQGITSYGEGMDAVRGARGLLTSPHGRVNWVQHLVGNRPLDVNVIFERIRQQGFFAGAQGGIFIAALTAVEYALWDLSGKALNLPVYRLLGGKFRDKIRIHCDTASSSEEPEDMARAAQEVVNHGFTAIKFDLDWNDDPRKWEPYNTTANNAELDRMMARMTAVREQIGKTEEEPLIQDGFITLSDKPGIGVTLFEDAVRKTAVPDYPFFT